MKHVTEVSVFHSMGLGYCELSCVAAVSLVQWPTKDMRDHDTRCYFFAKEEITADLGNSQQWRTNHPFLVICTDQ